MNFAKPMTSKKEYKAPYILILIATIVLIVLGVWAMAWNFLIFPIFSNFYKLADITATTEQDKVVLENSSNLFEKFRIFWLVTSFLSIAIGIIFLFFLPKIKLHNKKAAKITLILSIISIISLSGFIGGVLGLIGSILELTN